MHSLAWVRPGLTLVPSGTSDRNPGRENCWLGLAVFLDPLRSSPGYEHVSSSRISASGWAALRKRPLTACCRPATAGRGERAGRFTPVRGVLRVRKHTVPFSKEGRISAVFRRRPAIPRRTGPPPPGCSERLRERWGGG